MMFSNVEELKNSVDIVEYIGRYVELNYIGGEYKGLCPFHEENTPSLCINKEKNIWHCFGCNSGNDIIDFLRKYHNISFNRAVKKLCEDLGAELKETPSIIRQMKKYNRPESEKSIGHTYLIDGAMDEFPEDHHIKEWMEEGISYKVLCEHDVRYDSRKTQIVFPVFDEQEERKIIAIKSRTLCADWKEHGMPKYTLLGKMGKKDFMYWWKPNEKSIISSSECIIVEAEKSQMKLESYGINNVVAVGSHALSEFNERQILSAGIKNVVFGYDKDVTLEEIIRQTSILRHYTNCWYIKDVDGLIGAKDAPIDKGIEVWNRLYSNKIPIRS